MKRMLRSSVSETLKGRTEDKSLAKERAKGAAGMEEMILS